MSSGRKRRGKRAGKRRPSLARQCQMALESLLAIGQSKHEAKQRGEAQWGIYSWGAFRRYLSYCCRFLNWCGQRFGLKWLRDLRVEMGEAYLAHLRDDEKKAPATLKATRSALRKLERGVLKRFGVPVKIVPKDFDLPKRRISCRRRAGAYTADELRRLLAEFQGPEGDALRVQAHLGLRVSEVVRLRTRDVDLSGWVVAVRGKGGLVRYVSVPKEAQPLLARLVQGRAADDKLFPLVKPPALHRELMRACRLLGIPMMGTHALRRAYAQRLYAALTTAGLRDREARAEVAFRLGHRRVGVTYAYVPPQLRPWRRWGSSGPGAGAGRTAETQAGAEAIADAVGKEHDGQGWRGRGG